MAPKLVPEQYCRKGKENCLNEPIDPAAAIVISPGKVDLERQEDPQFCHVTLHMQKDQCRALLHI